MACDITRVFTSTVRALSTSVSRKSSTVSSAATEGKASPPATDSFSSRARRLHAELVTVRKHLVHAGELSRALATSDASLQRTYHEVVMVINNTLEQCGQLLQQLQRFRGEGERDKGQASEHRKAVCRSLEAFSKSLQRARDEQVSTYCRRVELACRLGEISPPPHQKSKLGNVIRKRSGDGAGRSGGGDTSWLFSASQSAEALPPDSLSEGELNQLEMENAEVYLHFLSERNEIQRLGSQISEIGRLQAVVTESLVEQAEMAQHIGEQVVGSTELVREANEHLRQSMDKTRSVRFWIIFILLTLTFSLHFLDWVYILTLNILLQLSCRSFHHISSLAFNQIRALHATKHHEQIFLTGIQPTGYPHLGNYFGMIKPCVKLQGRRNVDRFFLLIADLHALSIYGSVVDRIQATLQLTSALLACGIDPVLNSEDSTSKGKTILFPQSSVTGHCELAWILASHCTVNRLAHLPQWRAKSEAAGEAGASVALFTYPLLMAADVLLYAADFVPVGSDQVTHLELIRDLVRATLTYWPALQGLIKSPHMNLAETPKIYNLRDPTKKMSKSLGPEFGTIWLTDSPDTIRSKVTRAQTDSIRHLAYDPVDRPGVANLMQIFAAAKGIPVQEAIEQLVKLSKVELKNTVIDAVIEELTPIQAKLTELERSELAQNALSAGSQLANIVALQNLRKIKEAIGLHCY
ncbi:unnamed protein product [Hydatigera taeniaeformis]|uniref:tryptophan--tRNA ligase n=1 Tax=Hydatigena taeniaeformis TaxID=6205 RepID=A0A158RDS3_HYDTA|nr:unnamed protein product [Hydatigera taeniaeformis]